jgi:hypothetical protein
MGCEPQDESDAQSLCRQELRLAGRTCRGPHCRPLSGHPRGAYCKIMDGCVPWQVRRGFGRMILFFHHFRAPSSHWQKGGKEQGKDSTHLWANQSASEWDGLRFRFGRVCRMCAVLRQKRVRPKHAFHSSLQIPMEHRQKGGRKQVKDSTHLWAKQSGAVWVWLWAQSWASPWACSWGAW